MLTLLVVALSNACCTVRGAFLYCADRLFVGPFCVTASHTTRPVAALNVEVHDSPPPNGPASPRPKPPPSPTNAPCSPPPMNEPRSSAPSRPPPNQKPADGTLEAGVPTKLLDRSPYPTGTDENAPVNAPGESDDWLGFVSSAHA